VVGEAERAFSARVVSHMLEQILAEGEVGRAVAAQLDEVSEAELDGVDQIGLDACAVDQRSAAAVLAQAAGEEERAAAQDRAARPDDRQRTRGFEMRT
jgi:hypothetical protein